MVRYNPHSVLRNIDLSNPATLRRCMQAISSNLCPKSKNPFKPLTGEQATKFLLAPTDLAPLNRLLTAIALTHSEYPLLLQAVQRWLKSRDGDDEEVLMATKELEELGEENVLFNPEVWYDQYEEAMRGREKLKKMKGKVNSQTPEERRNEAL